MGNPDYNVGGGGGGLEGLESEERGESGTQIITWGVGGGD